MAADAVGDPQSFRPAQTQTRSATALHSGTVNSSASDTSSGMCGETPEQHCLTPTGGGGLILVLATMMLPPQVTLIPIFLIWNGLGVTDSYLPLILPTFLGTPFFIFLIRQFLMNVPDELIRSFPDRWCLRVPNLRDDRVTHRSSCYRDGCGIPVRLVVDRLSEPTYLLE